MYLEDVELREATWIYLARVDTSMDLRAFGKELRVFKIGGISGLGENN
jgi:hypothetical protein